jgi:hypothetical protein
VREWRLLDIAVLGRSPGSPTYHSVPPRTMLLCLKGEFGL